MCVDAGTICLHIFKRLESDREDTSQLPTHHTGELVLLTKYNTEMRKDVFVPAQSVCRRWWNRGGSVNTKETTYVVSVLHIGVQIF